MHNRCLLFLLSLPFVLQAAAQTWDTYCDTWVGTDDLGREMLPAGVAADSLAGRPSEVGMFYYLWHGKHTQAGRPIFDITRILASDPRHPHWGNVGEMHWWGKPVLGYYQAGDDFVIARHLQMLCDAGVDFLFFDVTNGFLYEDVVKKVIQGIARRDSSGMCFPRICFMSYWGGVGTVRKIYDSFYADGRYRKYWYCHEGKPLILADVHTLPKDSPLRDFFTFRKSWAWMKGARRNEWAWLEHYPQAPGWTVSPSVPEQLSVSVAQHATTKIGKSFHHGAEPPLDAYAVTDSTAYGLYFDEQWRTAHRVHPPVLMVTQFNEWTAQRFLVTDSAHLGETRPGAEPKIGETSFVDAFNAEFNRDIEPSRHPLIRDNYYMQFVSHMRRYKGHRSVPVQQVPHTIRLKGSFAQWNAVSYEYRDDRGDILHQNTLGFNQKDTMVNNTGRNDFVMSKVAHDHHRFYFMAETTAALTPSGPDGRSSWLMLLLSTGQNHAAWHGYDYCVKAVGRQLKLYANEGGHWQWRPLCTVPFRVEGNRLQLSIPRNKLCAAGHIDFKWTDNVPDQAGLDVLDFYVIGDVAPNGRFNYRYQYE